MKRSKHLALGLAIALAPIVTGLAEENPQIEFPLEVSTLVSSLDGAVGGVTVDALGYVYVADFGEKVWKVSPWGEVEVLTDEMYGASGNTIDANGDLLQSNFHAGTVARVTRDGTVSTLAEGLQGPVGLAVGSGELLYVTNCKSNSISRIDHDGTVTLFADGDHFNCPNSIAVGPDGAFYVLNFSDGRMLRITPEGQTSLFATIPGGGSGHLVVAGEEFYATGLRAGQIYRIDAEGRVESVAGSGRFAETDGLGRDAAFSTPNGIAWDPTRDVLYTNTYPVPWTDRFTGRVRPVSNLRAITIPNLRDRVAAAWEAGGRDAVLRAIHDYRAMRPGKVNELLLNLLGYDLLYNGNERLAVPVFEANTELYPESFNAWDSLAEAHKVLGNRERAVELYRKSLELNPGNLNAEKMLSELSAD